MFIFIPHYSLPARLSSPGIVSSRLVVAFFVVLSLHITPRSCDSLYLLLYTLIILKVVSFLASLSSHSRPPGSIPPVNFLGYILIYA